MKRILIIATRQIGDVLLTTPLVRAARETWPQARIEMLGFQGTLGMLAGNPDLDGCIETPARLGWTGTWQLARRLWRRYDLALVTQPGDRAHLLGWLAAGTRSGLLPEASSSNWWKRALLRHAVSIAGDLGTVHVVREKLELLTPWRQGPLPEPQVIPPAAAALPDELTRQLRAGHVVVHAPSMWAYKQWPLEHYASLVRGLIAAGHQVVLSGSGSARDQACIAPLRALGAPGDLIDASGRLDFPQLRRLIEGARLYIGPDTSVSHLAAATGTPTLALFGPTNPQRWAPWPACREDVIRFQRAAPFQRVGNVTLLQGAQACVPCGRAGCLDARYSRSDCLQSLDPEQVLRAALAQLTAVS